MSDFFLYSSQKRKVSATTPKTFPLNLELNSTKTMCYLLSIIVPENELFMSEMKMILKVNLV